MLNFSGMKAGALRGLAVAMMATGLLSAAPGVAWATDPVVTEFVKDVPYVDERGAECTTSWAVVVSSDDTTWGDDTAENWYVLREDVKVDERIEVQGDVKLILADSTLNAGGGIDVPKGSSLTVYLSHIDGSGDIYASLDGPDAGIGGSAGEDAGDITFVGGFADPDSVSGWARGAVAWAVEEGVISGVEGEYGSRSLEGQRPLTRAEMAAMVMNAVEAGVL